MSRNYDKFSEDYWKGVVDALSLIEDFIYWQREHPDESKDILEFVQECISEVRKKIGPSLLDILGISFAKKRKEEIKETEETTLYVESAPTKESGTQQEIQKGGETAGSSDNEIISEIDKLDLDLDDTG
ncbi:MAG: hypothetical protein J7L07_08245 [Candidatus Odinarchaeota archaeon]|nr:hypothetical protein [Candidatus Odinarchaeota archaeon]